MSGVSKIVIDRDRARLRFKESVMELAAVRGQEDDVIDKPIVKVNETFDEETGHVDSKLKFLGESFLKRGSASISLSVHDYSTGDAVLLKKLDKPPDASVKGGIVQSMLRVEQLMAEMSKAEEPDRVKLIMASVFTKKYNAIRREYNEKYEAGSDGRTKAFEQPEYSGAGSCVSTSNQKNSREYKVHGYELKQPGRLDILERGSCMERLFKDVSRVEEPDGLKLNRNYACTKEYREHEQIYDNKYKEAEHGLCISRKVGEINSKDFSEFESVANLQHASGIPESYKNIRAPYVRFDPCSTSSYINLTGIRGWVEEVLGNIYGAGQLGTVPQSSGEIGVGLVPSS